jgi:HD-GYP domain-containing protein (c-di-GMP phosphodiesterase class II)
MLKRVTIKQLRLGMFVHELCGSWMDHPFWKSAFLLEDQKDLQRLAASSITAVWIDTSRGLDLEAAVVPAVPNLASVDQASRAVADAAAAQAETREAATRAAEIQLHSAAQTAPASAKTSIAEELGRAATLCAEAKPAMQSMFNEVRMGRAIDAEGALPLVEEISGSVMRNPHALISLAQLKERDDYTYMHSVAVCALMVALSKRLGLSDEQTRQVGLGGLLHDLGKGGIPLDILNKPGKLTDGEFAVVKKHPEHGHRLLLEGGTAGTVPLDICLHHHEKIDGSGYPHRLAANDISMYAKMGAICDVYDAITSNRPYKNGWDPAESLRKMAEWSRGHFDESLFQAFVKCLGIYPVGSLIGLASGRLGVVVEQGGDSLLTPRVKVFFSTRLGRQIPVEIVDLSFPGTQDRIIGRENPEAWGFADLSTLWAA